MSRLAGMNSLWRSLSGASSKEIPHTHPSHTLRPTPSLDIESRTGPDSDALRSCTSLPAHVSLDGAGSLTESLASSSPTCSTLDSPTAAQQHKQQRQRPYKVHGMDPYDYWSLIKSL